MGGRSAPFSQRTPPDQRLCPRQGMGIVVWFEPERVAPGTWLAKTIPQWILGGEKGGLLNLGKVRRLGTGWSTTSTG